MTNDNVLQQLDDADLEIASLKMQLAAEQEISSELSQQVHELKAAISNADDWNKITSIEINNIRSLNKEIEEDKLKTELACEQWIRQCEELQQQLATEREKVQTLVDALTQISSGSECPSLIADEALAKMKEGQ
jgi:chromosome segregation ATPase